MTLSALAFSASLYKALAASACARTVAGEAAGAGMFPEAAGEEGGAIISRRISSAGQGNRDRTQAAEKGMSPCALPARPG